MAREATKAATMALPALRQSNLGAAAIFAPRASC
jgi:hypothetical protein